MLEHFFFNGLPYLAITIAVIGTIYRVRAARFSYSSLSSQFLEGRKLVWGSVPWHAGILVILLAHLFVLVAPGAWRALVTPRPALLAVEGLGMALAWLSLIGLALLMVRRLLDPRIQAVTNLMDLALLGLLFLQVALGLGTALSFRWGAAWSTGTMVPYLWSILSFRPDAALIAGMPLVLKAHIVGAWLILILLPFSRLVHLFAFPWRYWVRSPQRVVWSSVRRQEAAAPQMAEEGSRRQFLQSTGALLAGGGLLALLGLEKMLPYLLGPRLSQAQQAELLETRLSRLQATAEQEELALERLRNDFIKVASLAELKPDVGKYFIDYGMAPALAFLGKDGLPLLISAKCTHLGCTVGNQATDGKILCPCHVSYFEVANGRPTPGSPAKLPLPMLGWVVKDASGREVASRTPLGVVTRKLDPAALPSYSVYIVKSHVEGV